jgi:pyrroloquinoline-quinone synthase
MRIAATPVLDLLDRLRGDTDVLRHPFYLRWNAGELSESELRTYAGEYRHAVVAVADASARAAAVAPSEHRAGLAAHAAEEAAHVGLWDAFAASLGAPAAAAAGEPLPATGACAQAWAAGETLAEHLAVLYVLEAGQPAISRTKLDGLTAHYGYSEEGPATEYFRVHETLDVEHAAAARGLLAELLADGPDDARDALLARRAQAALRGNWELLDGVLAAGG